MKFQITQVSDSTTFHNTIGRWYISVNNQQYLHSDLTIHGTTLNSNGQYKGWYASREKARIALRSYKEKNRT